jgi:tetratricopeptide (TPR) repeat protein
MGKFNCSEPLPQAPSEGISAAFRKRGNAHLQSGELAEAAECYRKAVAADPADANAHVSLGFALRELQQFADANVVLHEAIALDPDVADAHYLLGTVAVARNAPDEAIGYFQKALAVQPDLDVACRDLFSLLFRTEAAARGRARRAPGPRTCAAPGNLLSQRADYAAAADCFSVGDLPGCSGVHNDLMRAEAGPPGGGELRGRRGQVTLMRSHQPRQP